MVERSTFGVFRVSGIAVEFIGIAIMIGIFVMQTMAIDPDERIHIKTESIVQNSDALYEPWLVIERAMRDAHMENVG